MTGKEYLEAIKKALLAGAPRRSRNGENVLAAFGYTRRTRAVIDEINAVLGQLGLMAEPSITQDMPLKERIRFSLAGVAPATSEAELEQEAAEDEQAEAEAEAVGATAVASFRVAELTSAKKDVECITPNAPVAEARTTMALKKYSQLVVASGAKPRRQDIKGIISYRSMARALLDGKPSEVRECMDSSIEEQIVSNDADLKKVVELLREHDVVLVIGQDHKLQGIVTAADLAEEFAQLVDPFKRIGEVETRLRALVSKKLGNARVIEFLAQRPPIPSGQTSNLSLEDLTIGELQRILEHPDNWKALGLEASHSRQLFIAALDELRGFRNRLMHFREPLQPQELIALANFCRIVREIPI